MNRSEMTRAVSGLWPTAVVCAMTAYLIIMSLHGWQHLSTDTMMSIALFPALVMLSRFCLGILIPQQTKENRPTSAR